MSAKSSHFEVLRRVLAGLEALRDDPGTVVNRARATDLIALLEPATLPDYPERLSLIAELAAGLPGGEASLSLSGTAAVEFVAALPGATRGASVYQYGDGSYRAIDFAEWELRHGNLSILLVRAASPYRPATDVEAAACRDHGRPVRPADYSMSATVTS